MLIGQSLQAKLSDRSIAFNGQKAKKGVTDAVLECAGYFFFRG
jgi:hypothetical protein